MSASDTNPQSQDQNAETPDKRPKHRILRNTAVLPGMFTISNGLCGFAAIHFATKVAIATETATAFHNSLSNIAIACWLLFGAMIFDMLDGRVARMTRRTTDFGAQLDSLCDVISFGVAPAILMLRTVAQTMAEMDTALASSRILERAVWAIAATYVACATLRLARFNVENEPDESAHMDFRGLPSPGAAAAIVGIILLFENLVNAKGRGWLSSSWTESNLFMESWFLGPACIFLSFVTLASALLMVSRVRYIHLVNHFIRGKRPFSYLVKLVFILLAMVLEPMFTLAIATTGFALSGPITHLRLRKKALTAA